MPRKTTRTVKSDGFRGKAWKKAKGTDVSFPKPKTTLQYDEPIGPERKSGLQQLKERVTPILGRIQSGAASINAHGRSNAWITPPPAGYFGGLPGEQHHEQPRKRKGKRRRRREPEDDGPDWQAMSAVPPEVRRWMM